MAGGLEDGGVLRDWLGRAVPALGAARDRIDAVNVFPVPDGDTGTNVLLTLRGAADAVEALGADAGGDEVLRVLARGALLSARGNSGVILSRYLGEVAATASLPLPEVLRAAADAAREAVPEPEEGTVLTVAAAVAAAAREAARDGADDLAALVAGVTSGRAGLVGISAAHPVLRSARVVDAGACALLVLLDALAAALAGRPGAVDVGWLPDRGGPAADEPAAPVPAAGAGGYEVVAVLRAEDADAAARALGAPLGAVGDAVAVVPGDRVVTAHVHAVDPVAVAAVLSASGARWTATVRPLLGGAGPLVACTGAPAATAALADAGAVAVLLPDGTPPGEALEAVHRAAQDAAGVARRPPVTLLGGDRFPPADLRAAVARWPEAAAPLPGDGPWAVVADAPDDVAVLAALAPAAPAASTAPAAPGGALAGAAPASADQPPATRAPATEVHL